MKYRWACPYCKELSSDSAIFKVARIALGHLDRAHGMGAEKVNSYLEIEKLEG